MTDFEVGDRVRWRGMEHLGEGRIVEDTRNLTLDGETGVHFPTYAAYHSDAEYHAIPEDELVAAEKGLRNSPDAVNHPAHYNQGKIEVWDFIYDQGLGYALGNAVKYITRAGKKDSETTVQDLRKAIAFLEREIRFEETGE